jgi:Na+/alanine symporter
MHYVVVFYCLYATIVIVSNYALLPAAIGNIFTGAFGPEGVASSAPYFAAINTYPTKARSTT